MLLKPQDVLLTLKLACQPADKTYAALAASLGLSASETHAAARRAQRCRILTKTTHPEPVWQNLHDVLVHALPLVLPLEKGAPVLGMPTSYAAPPIAERILMEDGNLPPVWEDDEGNVTGIAVSPLYSSAPYAARQDGQLYQWLALVDALRCQEPRVRELALTEVEAKLQVLSFR